jgi:hypothetical protein
VSAGGKGGNVTAERLTYVTVAVSGRICPANGRQRLTRLDTEADQVSHVWLLVTQ